MISNITTTTYWFTTVSVNAADAADDADFSKGYSIYNISWGHQKLYWIFVMRSLNELTTVRNVNQTFNLFILNNGNGDNNNLNKNIIIFIAVITNHDKHKSETKLNDKKQIQLGQ